MTRVVRRFFQSTFAAGALLLCLAPAAASAHAVLESSTPAASSTVPTSPPEIVLEFNEPVSSTLAEIQLFDSDSKRVTIGKTVRDSSDTSKVHASLPTLTDGAYVVVWRVSSADGHPVQGAFPFEVGSTSSGIGNDLVNDVVSRLGSTSKLGIVLGVFRFFSFVGCAVLIGVVALTGGGALLRTRRALTIANSGLIFLLVGSVGHLFLQGPYVTRGSWSEITNLSLVGDVAQTRLGFFLLIRLLVIAAIALLLWSLGRRPEESGVRQSVATLSCIALITSFSATGHASSLSFSLVSVIVDGVHLLAISAWMGGLIALVFAGASGASAEVRGENLVNRFSRLATYLLPVAVVTGVVSSIRILDGWSGVSDSTYGRMLVIKVAVVVMIIALGAVARTALRRNGAESIRRGIVVEALLGVAVLGLTAGLVALSPLSSSGSRASTSVTLTQNDIVANITFTPTVVGLSEVHVIVTPPGGSLTPVVNVSGRFSLPDKNIPAIPIQMVSIGTNHWSGTIQVPYPGEWSLQVLVKPDANTVASFTTQVQIKG